MDLTRRGLISRAVAAGAALATARMLGDGEIAFAGSDGEAVFEARVPRRAGQGAARAGSGSAHAGSARAGSARARSAWRSGAIRAPRRFELLGVEIPRGGDPEIEIRARMRGGSWSPWLAAPLSDGHAPDGSGAGDGSGASDGSRASDGSGAGDQSGRRLTEPVWTGPAEVYELRARRPLHGARIVFVDGGQTPSAAASSRFVRTGLEAGPGQPRIIARAAWATRACRPRESAAYGGLALAVVHHTVNANYYSRGQSAAMVRSICLFHKYGNRWNDIGYNFVVDRYGQVFEGRQGGVDEPLVGAHAGGYNVYSSGVALLGTHTGVGPTRRAFDALAQLIAWKLSLHGIAPRGRTTVEVTRPEAPVTRYRPGTRVSLNRIAAHGDGNTTSCPGAAMRRQLPRLRRVAARLAGTPSSLSLALAHTSPGNVLVSGQVHRDGSPITGAAIEIQRRTRSGWVTAGGATTQADGTFSAGVALSRNTILRAAFRGQEGFSAVISPRVGAVVPPVITLAASTQQLPPGGVTELSGTIAPANERILTLSVHQHQPDGVSTVVVRTIRFRSSDDGTFTRTVGFPQPGRYDVVVASAADSQNDAGQSAAIAITVA